MNRTHWWLAVAVLVGGMATPVHAQQRQKRPVTYTVRSTAVVKTQWSPNSTSPNSGVPNQPAATGTALGANGAMASTPAVLPGTTAQPIAFTQGFSNSPSGGQAASTAQPTAGAQSADVQTAPPPTNQQLQNPSGGFQLTHSGFTQNAYFSPNNYFGPQFNDWSNTRTLPNSLSAFDSFNRYQPDVISDSYLSLNSYVGSSNNQWSNLWSGSAMPNDIGGWNLLP